MTLVSRPARKVTQARLEGVWTLPTVLYSFTIGDLVARLLRPASADAQGPQLAYLWRRFGYPVYSWDPEASLVHYLLSTPDPDIVLVCDPRPDLVGSFWFGLSAVLAAELAEATTTVLDSAEAYPAIVAGLRRTVVHQRIEAALAATLADLLRPVYLGERAINILGAVEAAAGAGLRSTSRYADAGHGVGHDFDPTIAPNLYELAEEAWDDPDPEAWAAAESVALGNLPAAGEMPARHAPILMPLRSPAWPPAAPDDDRPVGASA